MALTRYDKLTWVVFAHGVAGVNFEHSPVDGAQLVFSIEDLTLTLPLTLIWSPNPNQARSLSSP